MTIIPLLLRLLNKLCAELNTDRNNMFINPNKNEHILHHRVIQNSKRAKYICIPCLLWGEAFQYPTLKQGSEAQHFTSVVFHSVTMSQNTQGSYFSK